MKKVFVLGQAPPRVSTNRPFGTTALYKWFESAGITEEQIANGFAFGALINYFPGSKNGSHLAPTPQQIREARPGLIEIISSFRPDILVPVGTLAIRELLNNPFIKLEQAVGQSFFIEPFGALGYKAFIIPLPHPSGASPWVHIKNNRILLDKALEILKHELNQSKTTDV